MTDADILIIGAGHNALVCATYLARAGKRVLCLEAAATAGGMASYRSFGEGYFAPFAHAQLPADEQLRQDLDLDRHGYTPGQAAPTTVLHPEGHTLTALRTELTGAVGEDAAAYAALRTRFEHFARRLDGLFHRAPPRLKHLSGTDLRAAAGLAMNLRFGLGRDELQELLRVLGMNIYDLLDETFEDDRVKGLVALEALQGSAMGPRTPGTVLTWLHRLANAKGKDAVVCGNGNNDLTTALANALKAAGGNIRYGAAVQSITTAGGRVSGITLIDGGTLLAPTVVSGADPRVTFQRLLGLQHLDATFARRVTQIRGKGVVAKLHLGLDSLPEFSGVDEKALAGKLLVAPSADYIERAFNPSKYGRHSPDPVLEMTLPSLTAPQLAPTGKQLLSINVSFVPYQGGDDTQPVNEAVLERVLATLEQHDSGIRARVTCNDLMTPRDIEQVYGAAQGHWHHGELSMHQSMMLRPLYGAAQYATPVKGLYLCSAGCHPGGDVAGFAGRNAAQAILASEGTQR